MLTAVDILCYNSSCITPDNELFTLEYDLNFTNNIDFQSLEVVCRGSETQLQVTSYSNEADRAI